MQQELINFLEGFASKKNIFVNKKVFLPSYKPSVVIHRNDIIEQIAKILAPVLKLEKPSNLFIYGKTGSGKTLSVNDVLSGFNTLAAKKKHSTSFYFFMNVVPIHKAMVLKIH